MPAGNDNVGGRRTGTSKKNAHCSFVERITETSALWLKVPVMFTSVESVLNCARVFWNKSNADADRQNSFSTRFPHRVNSLAGLTIT